jgi:plasmid stabilization system protein ParE
VRRLLLRPAAAADIEEAVNWYDNQRSGLGDEFLASVDAGLVDLAAFPLRHPVLFRDIRRYLLKRFPYALFYRVYPDAIVVVACMHGRRDPLHWHERK